MAHKKQTSVSVPATPVTQEHLAAHLAKVRADSQAELARIDRETREHIQAEVQAAATRKLPQRRSEQARIADTDQGA